jgi:tetratricopeptide (TPR) repeat protein
MKTLFLGLGLGIIISLLDVNLAFADAKSTIEQLSPKVETLDRKALVTLGKAYSEVGNSNAAIKIFTAMLSKNAKDVEAQTLIGGELLILKKDQEALETLKAALSSNKKYLPAYRVLIKHYESKQNKYELRLIYQDLLENIGEKLEFITQLCVLTTMDGLYDLSSSYCQKGMRMAAREPLNFVHWGITLRETGRTEEANKTLKQSANKFKASLLAQMTWANYLEADKNYIDSYSYFKRATNVSAKDYKAQVGLAVSAYEIQKFDESLAAFLAACNLDRAVTPLFRKAASGLKTMKIEGWIRKFETGSERCGLTKN